MDYDGFERAMERAGKALFLDNDTERCMKIMQSIMNKFDPKRLCPERPSPTPPRLACFVGACGVIQAIVVHVSTAKHWAATGDLRSTYTALQHLLVLSFFWRRPSPTSSAPLALPSANDYSDYTMSTNTTTSNCRAQLPAEIWCEVATWLSRPDWRTLLYVPHPLRRFALDFFFRDIFLQFDMYGHHPGDVGPKFGVKELEAWHSKRSLDIMTRILRDRSFANRVRTLKVLMCDHRKSGLTDVIDDLNIACLSQALCRMAGLKKLYLYGCPMFLHVLVSHLPRISPRLQAVTVKYHTYDGRVYFPRIPTPWDHLEQLCVYPTAEDFSMYSGGLQQLAKTLRRLRMTHRSNLTPTITTLAGKLTHLELITTWGAVNEISLFQVVLGNCEHLESLRLIGCPLQTHSVYFRQYPHSLPRLRDFGVRLVQGPLMVVDPDFFPAICDFLRDRPMLESLELKSYAPQNDQTAFGFDMHVWEFFSSLQHLRILSTKTVETIPHKRMVELIPRSVKTLTMSMCDWHLEKMLQEDGWPDDLHFFGFTEHLHQSTISLAKKIAASVPSVRVVRIVDDYFSVMSREHGKPVQVDQWTSRATKIFRKEYLEVYGCDDHEYLYADQDGILS